METELNDSETVERSAQKTGPLYSLSAGLSAKAEMDTDPILFLRDSWVTLNRKDVGERFLFRRGDLPERRDIFHVASFAVDNCIIWSDRGQRFSSRPDDWVFSYPSVPPMLRKLHDDGWIVVLFADLEVPEQELFTLQRIEDVIDNLGFVPFVVATRDVADFARRTKWDLLIHLISETIALEDPYYQPDTLSVSPTLAISDESFYCGYRVGPAAANPFYRSSTVDSDFAAVADLIFYLPDVMFPPIEDVPVPNDAIIVVAAAPYMYSEYFKRMMRLDSQLIYTTSSRLHKVNRNFIPIILPSVELFATETSRRNILGKVSANALIYWFTQPPTPEQQHEYGSQIHTFARNFQPFTEQEMELVVRIN